MVKEHFLLKRHDVFRQRVLADGDLQTVMELSPVRLPALEASPASSQHDHIRSIDPVAVIPVVMAEKTGGDFIGFEEGKELLLTGKIESGNHSGREDNG